MKKISFVTATLLAFIVILVMAVGGSGCANIVPPSGGPRDSIPPLLLKTTPGDSTRNFKGNKITFTFDEFIDVDNPSENLLISPSPKSQPVVDHKLNTL
ncbi:MAG TPA: Ig-like domain-containing protein, partial [Chitinophagaceae bacterium]|nr:Ig-like domain-containing protein [Chitinophagaceae bacterium]